MDRITDWPRTTASLGLVVVVMAAGCESPTPASTSFVTQDSSGLFIAHNTGDLAVGSGSIRVVGEPLVSIGAVAGDSVYQFSRIRGGARLADGRLAVVDANSRQVRIFDEAGTFIRSWGRRGDGPGEFQRPALAGTHGDTLVLIDPNNRRLTWMLADAGIVREVRINEEAGGGLGRGRARGVLADGSVVAGGSFFFSSASGESLSSGLRRSPTSFSRIGPDGNVATDFGEFPGLEMYFEVDGGRVSARLIPFGRVSSAGVAGDRVYIGTADAPEVGVYDPDGTQIGIVRWEAPRIPVNADHLAAYLEESLADADDEDERRRIRVVTRDHAREEFPPYQGLQTDVVGNLWVNEYLEPGNDIARYRVFSPAGQMLARVALPPRVAPLEIGLDYMLARRLDDFDIEYVELYRLVRD